MKRTKTILILFASAVICGIIGAAALVYALNFDFNTEISHFAQSSVAATVTSCILAVSFFLAAASYIVAGKNIFIKEQKAPRTFTSIFISTLAGCATLLSGIFSLTDTLPDEKPFIFIVKVIFTFLSAFFFFAEALGFTFKKPELGLFALAPAVMFAFTILYTYFDPSYAMNSTAKTFEIVMLVSFMLYFKDISGAYVSRPGTVRKLAFSGVLAVGAGGCVSAARFISSFIYSNGLGLSLIKTGLELVIWAYIFIHFIQNTLDFGEKESAETFNDSKSSGEVPEEGDLNELEEEADADENRDADIYDAPDDLGDDLDYSDFPDDSDDSDASESPRMQELFNKYIAEEGGSPMEAEKKPASRQNGEFSLNSEPKKTKTDNNFSLNETDE